MHDSSHVRSSLDQFDFFVSVSSGKTIQSSRLEVLKPRPYWCEKARKHMCVTESHDMTLAVKAALNPYTTNNHHIDQRDVNHKQKARIIHFLLICLSLLLKHVRKIVGGFGKERWVSTGVRKPGNTCTSPTAII